MRHQWCLPAVPKGSPTTFRPTPLNAALRDTANELREAPIEVLRAAPSPECKRKSVYKYSQDKCIN